MHATAYEFVRQAVSDYHITQEASVIEIGGRNINGTVRDHFGPYYTSIDLYEGPGVDVVGNAALYVPPVLCEVVVCCEVFEHTDKGPELCKAAYSWLHPGGHFIISCATDPRAPHSALDEEPIRPDEHYKNVSAEELYQWLRAAGFNWIEFPEPVTGDLYAVALK